MNCTVQGVLHNETGGEHRFQDFETKGSTALEQNNRNRNEIEIDLGAVFQILLSKWYLILIAGLIAGMAAGLVTKFFIKKTYKAYTSMYIFTNANNEQTGTVSYAELSAADNLISTYRVIIKSNSVLDIIAERFNAEHPEHANKGITAGSLAGVTSVSVPTNAKLIEIDVITRDPVLSADIANTFAKYVPDQIIRVTKAGGVEIVDYATVPKGAYSPNLTRNVAIGFAGGFLLAAAFFVLRALLDTTIYTSEEVQKVSRCPVLATVPMIVVGDEEVSTWEVSLREEIINV